jgi:[CysO sulfur-carrier protein]-S-L-cysteine hydrolase
MIVLEPGHLETIVAHARRDAPHEACGLLAGREGHVRRVFPMKNAEPAERRPVAYRLEPEEQYRVLMEIESSGWELVGIYHSHPNGQAYPSATDVGLALYPGVVYLIVSLLDPNRPAARGFLIDHQEITETDIRITNGR